MRDMANEKGRKNIVHMRKKRKQKRESTRDCNGRDHPQRRQTGSAATSIVRVHTIKATHVHSQLDANITTTFQ